MELIDRYVKDVSRRLPERRRADVEAELRSAIMDAADGRGARTDDEIVAVLREFGDPATVAAGYDPSGQYLIGPELYPSYRRVLRQGLAIAVAIAGLWLAVRLATGAGSAMEAGEEMWEALELGVRAAAGTLIGITATFALFQRSGAIRKLPKREWDPRTLPDHLDADRINRLEAAFSLVVLAIGFSIVSAIGYEARTNIGEAAPVLRPLITAALVTGIPWLVASILVEAVVQAGLLLEGRWRIWWRVLHVLSDVLSVIAFGLAGFAVFTERAALETVGMPPVAVNVLGVGLLLVALIIGATAVGRERKLSKRRAEERASAGRPTVPALLV